MIICFKCPPETKKDLDNLLLSGQYKDYTEIISSAVANLAVLQQELSQTGAIIIGSGDSWEGHRISAAMEENRKEAGQEPLGTLPEIQPKPIKRSVSQPDQIPSIFLINGVKVPQSALAAPPSDVWVNGHEVPLDRWLFGQYNKLLPAKANCRALVNLMDGKTKGVPLEEAALKIAEEATTLGDFLIRLDEQHGIGRDDALSTAFPSTGGNSEKARLRYANQFVASVNNQRQVSGLLIDLKLINFTRGKDIRLLLTEVGWHFASLPNPILDSPQETLAHKFSAEEIDFLLNHIAHSVPAEDFAYRTIIAAIAQGADTPEKIDAALEKYVTKSKKRDLSKSFLSSQRSGAISRMADLGLVTRVRDGVRVLYVITEKGSEFTSPARKSTRRNDQ